MLYLGRVKRRESECDIELLPDCIGNFADIMQVEKAGETISV